MKRAREINSSRRYIITFITGTYVVTEEIPVNKISEQEDDTFEYIYAMSEQLDEILDLKLGEVMYMNFDRLNADCKGILKRIK